MSLTITAGAPLHSPRAAAAVTGAGIPPPHGYALSGKIMLSAIVVLFTVVLIILFVHLYVRWHVYRREARRQRRRRRLIFTSAADQAAASPHGLDPLVIKSLAVEIFSASEELAGDVSECAVCLCEFDDGEKVRVLPRCDHRFHIDCIDMWFCTHSSCPLCRSAVEIEAPPARCSVRAIGSSSDSGSEESIEMPRTDDELGHKSRILAIKRFFSRDQRPIQDLERGEAAERSQPPPPPPPPAE